jgi:hypothetical protein
MFITRTSWVSGRTTTLDLDVTTEQLRAWKGGACIQDVMPHLSAGQREFIMTGTTEEEWERIFPTP